MSPQGAHRVTLPTRYRFAIYLHLCDELWIIFALYTTALREICWSSELISFETMKSAKSPFPKSVYERNAHLYKILANPKRLEILNILKEHELSVNELAKILGLSKANVSQHLALLRYARAVTVRRNGLNAFYKITDPKIVEPCRIFKELWSRSVPITGMV